MSALSAFVLDDGSIQTPNPATGFHDSHVPLPCPLEVRPS